VMARECSKGLNSDGRQNRKRAGTMQYCAIGVSLPNYLHYEF
jgi:hypothetical protein